MKNRIYGDIAHNYYLRDICFKGIWVNSLFLIYVVAFVEPGNKKKKGTKAENLRLLQEEEERRQKEEGIKYSDAIFTRRGCQPQVGISVVQSIYFKRIFKII